MTKEGFRPLLLHIKVMDMTDKKYTVYMHTNKINNKSYVGITSKPVEQRWRNNGYGYKCNQHFWNAICKYGWDNFDHDILFTNLTKEKACEIEKVLISVFMTQDPSMGYNKASGGEVNEGFHLSDEAKKKLSESHKGIFDGQNNPMYGISPRERMDEVTYANWKKAAQERLSSEEYREKLRKANIGKKYSDEINKKKGRKGKEHHNYGKTMPDEVKEKIRRANIGRKHSDEINAKKGHKGVLNNSARSVCQFEKDGTFVQQWPYATLASDALNIDLSSIIACCRGTNGRKSAGGYVWTYAYNKEVAV